MEKRYEHLLFDLDHTLWDFDRCSEEALRELFDSHSLHQFGEFSQDHWVHSFRQVNEGLWHRYNLGEIERDYIRNNRFALVFQRLGVAREEVPLNMAADYMALCPRKPYAIPYAIEVLDYLKGRYQLHIITNGFADVQGIKMKSAGLDGYFDVVVTSESSGAKKPDPLIFTYALEQAGAEPGHCLMIGDNLEADVMGARNAQIDQVYFNPAQNTHEEQVTHEITCLSQLKEIL